MQIILHTGNTIRALEGVRRALWAARKPLGAAAILLPAVLAEEMAQLRLLAAVQAQDLHPLVISLGLSDAGMRERVLAGILADLRSEVIARRPHTLLLSLPEAALWCDTRQSVASLYTALSQITDDIRVVMHLVDRPSALANLLPLQIAQGRTSGLEGLTRSGSDGTLVRHPAVDGPPVAAEAEALLRLWGEVFGPDAVLCHPLAADDASDKVLTDLKAVLGARATQVHLSVPPLPAMPSVGTIQRRIALNRHLATIEAETGALPYGLRHRLLAAVSLRGRTFDRAYLATQLAGTAKTRFQPDAKADFSDLFADLPQEIAQARAALAAALPEALVASPNPNPAVQRERPASAPLSQAAETLFSPTAHEVFRSFSNSRFGPRNSGVVSFDESVPMVPAPTNPSPPTGTVLIGCMKNEGPYILEWIAYHHSIGVDHFVIYTNDCSDQTDAILNRLAEMGLVTHENNDEWKGKSPQQAALNKAMRLPVVQQAKWLIHIDIDEFINIRIGDGTLATLYDAMGDASNLAMTWRLFGNDGIEEIGDASVISRFTGCAPAYCPKPHTSWGFKSITRNVGAYDKLSCHRPNHLDAAMVPQVRWLNGSLLDVTSEFAEKGWRSTLTSIGYDAVQLNHYALRSRESYLIKRQRGRALHVDRSIGLNYWIRHDWNLARDCTIQRNLPRLETALATLRADPELARLHRESLAWHQAKAQELKEVPDFAQLMYQTKNAALTDLERVAYAVAEDMES